MPRLLPLTLLALAACADRRPRAAPDVAPAASPDVAADVAPDVDDAWRTPGTLRRAPRELLVPPGTPEHDRCVDADGAWLFPRSTPAAVAEFFARAEVPAPIAQTLLRALVCEGVVCRVTPDDATLLRLPSDARGRLYRALGRYNGAMFSAVPFRRLLDFGPWSALPGVPEAARPMLEALTWRERGVEYLVDLPYVCRHLPDPAARRALFDALDRRYTLDVWVRVPDAGSLAPIARYWSHPDANPDVEAMLRDARLEPEAAVPVARLLPPMPRRLLGRFPDPQAPPYDCYWTALHFFDRDAEAHAPPGQQGFEAALAARWRQVPADELRFGDMVVLYEGGSPVHACTHLAEDLVFTKNGGHARRPWIIQSIHDVRRDYAWSSEARYFRRAGP